MKKQYIDQGSHFAAAILILLMFYYGGVIGSALAGFGVGFVRELTEEGDRVTLSAAKAALGSWLDLSFWTLGGVAAKVITLVL